MAKKTFKGRVVLPGKISGKATVSKQAFNTSGSYMENMFAGKTDAAPCTDASNKELFGKDLSGAILCIPTTVGSTMGGMSLMGMKAIGVGPDALQSFNFSEEAFPIRKNLVLGLAHRGVEIGGQHGGLRCLCLGSVARLPDLSR